MAGCTSENCSQLYADIEVLEKKKILIQSPVEDGVAKAAAHRIVEHRRLADEKYLEQDELGLEGEGPIFELTQNDVHFPEFGGGLHDMYERQRVLRPKEYNKDEHNTVVSAFESLRNGAKQAAHIVHHYNEQGELDVRDVVVLTYDHETNKGRMHVLNIAKEGKNHHSLESAREAMQERLTGFKEERSAEGVFLFVRQEEAVNPRSLFRDKEQGLERPDTFSSTWKHERLDQLTEVERRQNIRPVFRADAGDDHVPFRLPFFLARLMSRDDQKMIVEQKKQNEAKEKRLNTSVKESQNLKNKEQKRKRSEKEVTPLVDRIQKQKELFGEKKKRVPD